MADPFSEHCHALAGGEDFVNGYVQVSVDVEIDIGVLSRMFLREVAHNL